MLGNFFSQASSELGPVLAFMTLEQSTAQWLSKCLVISRSWVQTGFFLFLRFDRKSVLNKVGLLN